MPTVSVLIPTYNRAEILRSAIASVLNQTFQDFEIIVIDDASKDNTRELVTGFNDWRIKYIRNEVNKGDAATRNAGIKISRGKYIAFLDDDDEWLPKKLERQVDLLENSPSKFGVVYLGYVKIDRVTGKILAQKIPTKRGNIFKDLLLENFINTSSLFLRRECFEKVGLFDENIPYCNDYDMWIRISREFHFECIKEPLVKYYIHGNGRLTANHELVIRGGEALLKKYDQLLALDRKYYSTFCLNLGVRYCYTGNVKKGRVVFLKAIRLYPFEIRNYFNLGLSLLGPDAFKKLKGIKEKLVDLLKVSEI